MSEVRYQRHADVRLTDVDGEGVALHLGRRQYFSFNETGLVLLRAMDQPATFGELVASLREEYEVSREEAEDTVRAFLDDCLANAVIVERAE